MVRTPAFAVIGGSGLYGIDGLTNPGEETVDTPYGAPSSSLYRGNLGGSDLIFLARHGVQHTIAPHLVNYRANIQALKDAGVNKIVAVAAVGAIPSTMTPGSLVLPNQIIDYTWGRESTFYDGVAAPLDHIDFTVPYSEDLAQDIRVAALQADVLIHDGAVYGATQGPRLESAAEIDRLEKDGVDIVGMTGMPEAALAREAGLAYATIAMVANAAAGRGAGLITLEDIHRNIEKAVNDVHQVLTALSNTYSTG